LDQREYIDNMQVIAHVPAPDGQYLNLAGLIYAIGKRRFLLPHALTRRVIEITDPRNPVVINENGAPGQVAFHHRLKKWILMEPVEVMSSVDGAGVSGPLGKYGDPNFVKRFRADNSFRGIRMWDVSDPSNFKLLSEFNTGPSGVGAHPDGCYWDGGKYAYLAVAPDDSYVHMMSPVLLLSHCLMVVDVSDPMNVKEVTRWWVPGQRSGELKDLKRWNVMAGRANDIPDKHFNLEETIAAFSALKGFDVPRMPATNLHGPVYVPKRVEDGGAIGYGSWSGLGFLIHDFSDIQNPRVISTFDPTPMYGAEGIGMHTIWLGMLSRGYVVTIPEPIQADGKEVFLPSWVIDVRDPSRPVPVAQLPRPKPPADAPYNDFVLARGRFGPHLPPHLTAPGKMRNDFMPLSYFNAGLRCYDLSNPTRPKEAGYFIPGHVGDETDVRSVFRLVDDVSIEWDRRLIYAGTTSGIYILSCPALGAPILDAMPVREWSLPGINVGAP